MTGPGRRLNRNSTTTRGHILRLAGVLEDHAMMLRRL